MITMIKPSAMALFGALAFTSASQVHPYLPAMPTPVVATVDHVLASDVGATSLETLAVYYTPLSSTEVSKYVGLGLAYHMALVYTDAAGRSYGATSGPSNLRASQTPGVAVTAMFSVADNAPSSFGTLVADPHNNTPFTIGGAKDYYTRDGGGRAYPKSIVLRGRDLSARWATIVRTYAKIGSLNLTYSPITQNSNSMAATALRRVGVELEFSSSSLFAPGQFTQLPEA